MSDAWVDVGAVWVVVNEGPGQPAIRITANHATQGSGEVFLAPAEEAELLRVLLARANKEPEYPT